MGDTVCLVTDDIGQHDREIEYKILLRDGPILFTYESDKGKRGIFGRVSGRFWAGRGSHSPLVPDGWIVCLDTDEIGRHDREIAYEFLLWDGPILLTYESDKAKRGVFGCVSSRFGAGRGSRWVPDG